MSNSYKQSVYIAIIRISANLIMLCSVFLAMRQASRWAAWPTEAVFCLFFFGISIPAWIIAWRLTRLTRKLFPAERQSLIKLPILGEQLISWRVADENRLAPLLPPKLKNPQAD